MFSSLLCSVSTKVFLSLTSDELQRERHILHTLPVYQLHSGQFSLRGSQYTPIHDMHMRYQVSSARTFQRPVPHPVM
jgi:hypothetical protein